MVVKSDSQLVVNQFSGDYECNEPRLQAYLSQVQKLVGPLKHFEIHLIPRSANSKADWLAKVAAGYLEAELPSSVFFELLPSPSVDDPVTINEIGEVDDWRTPIVKYLASAIEPEDPAECRKLRHAASRYWWDGQTLYRQAFSHPLLRCVSVDEGRKALKEVHEGDCASHQGARSLASKIFRVGIYWPTILHEAKETVKRCDSCQRTASLIHAPARPYTAIEVPWPFYRWGLDFLGPFPLAPGGFKFLLVAVDYFTKWVEAEPLVNITGQKTAKFLWKNIICRFGIPRHLTTDHGTQFESQPFVELCDRYGIQVHYSSVAHPQSNGQAEVSNRIILQGLRRCAGKAKGLWVDDLQRILWSYRVTPHTSTGRSPFEMTYGAEAVVPAEIVTSSPRITDFNEDDNLEGLHVGLDTLEERRQEARLKNLSLRQKAAKLYNKRVRPRAFREGDLVLRRVDHTGQHVDKLSHNWEGPYIIDKALAKGAYLLKRMDGSDVPRTWNVESLKHYQV